MTKSFVTETASVSADRKTLTVNVSALVLSLGVLVFLTAANIRQTKFT